MVECCVIYCLISTEIIRSYDYWSLEFRIAGYKEIFFFATIKNINFLYLQKWFSLRWLSYFFVAFKNKVIINKNVVEFLFFPVSETSVKAKKIQSITNTMLIMHHI